MHHGYICHHYNLFTYVMSCVLMLLACFGSCRQRKYQGITDADDDADDDGDDENDNDDNDDDDDGGDEDDDD